MSIADFELRAFLGCISAARGDASMGIAVVRAPVARLAAITRYSNYASIKTRCASCHSVPSLPCDLHDFLGD